MHHHHHGILGHHTTIAIILALLSAVAFAVATVAQQRAASKVTDDEVDRGQLIGVLLRRPLWWAGTLGNLGGYLLQAVALGFGSLLVVQPLLVTSILFALPLEARVAKVKLRRHVWIWGSALVMALAIFVVVGNPSRGLEQPHPRSWILLLLVGGPLVALCVAVGLRRSGATRSSLLALAVGFLAGVAALLTKVVVELVQHGPGAVFTSWETYALVVVGLGGVYLQQVAFQAGSLRTSMPIIQVVEPLTASILGVLLLEEHLRVGHGKLLLMAVATVIMVVATVELALGQAQVESDHYVSHAHLPH
ncbi:hypothetical protein SAMN05892883_0510 [Jatrophihabitans sp. GAS493]|uniref:DMT family transporter n=1 Tax=Jatrophihabitans sp. GAS493 TaxID=1907575 RepID=UPI000BC0A562|nr:DMT family transporter [Jatrophihabitans sp. GAS493]SOD70873.1 hypothetical protein SAMN05892883_0510 [Jatrophihabitans sp. GAS493]